MGRESHRETVKKKRAITQKWKASNNWPHIHRNKYNTEMGGTQNGQMNLREFFFQKKKKKRAQLELKKIKTVKYRKEINTFVTNLKKRLENKKSSDTKPTKMEDERKGEQTNRAAKYVKKSNHKHGF